MTITTNHPAIRTKGKALTIGQEYYYSEFDYPLPKNLFRARVRLLQADETELHIKLLLEIMEIYYDRYDIGHVGKRFEADQRKDVASMWTLSELGA